jgi:transcriptional regulator of acetoin/glycerol metabolism
VARSRHADIVESAVAGESPVQTDSGIVHSWRRCSGDYHVDPRSGATPHIIAQTELALFKEPVTDVLLHAREEIDRLYAIVRQEDYVVLLCNPEGIAIQHRGDETKRRSSNIGASGWEEFGPSKSRGLTESELRSLNNVQSSSNVGSTFARATPT